MFRIKWKTGCVNLLHLEKNYDSKGKKNWLENLSNLVKRVSAEPSSTVKKFWKGEEENWLHTKQKVTGDAFTDKESKVIYDYWTNTASQPTGDNKDFSKKRKGKNEYIHHAKHVLEKAHTKEFIEFNKLHPEIKNWNWNIFLSSRPGKDTKSLSLCRKHVETQIVFSICMKFRKAAMKTSVGEDMSVQVSTTLSEAVESTLYLNQVLHSTTSSACIENATNVV